MAVIMLDKSSILMLPNVLQGLEPPNQRTSTKSPLFSLLAEAQHKYT
jgi:hypothetical protein